MIDYELLLLLDPELSEERQGEIVERLRDEVTKAGGSVDRHDPWGKRRLAYEINHKADGFYHLMHFAATPETLGELTRVLKIDDGVLRHMATRRIETGAGQALPVGGPPRDEPSPESVTGDAEEA